MGVRRLGFSAQVWWKCHLAGGGGGGWGRSNRKLSPKSDMLKIFKKIWLQYFGYITCRSCFQIRPIIGDEGKKKWGCWWVRGDQTGKWAQKKMTLSDSECRQQPYISQRLNIFFWTHINLRWRKQLSSVFFLRKTNFTPLPTHPTASKKLLRSAP